MTTSDRIQKLAQDVRSLRRQITSAQVSFQSLAPGQVVEFQTTLVPTRGKPYPDSPKAKEKFVLQVESKDGKLFNLVDPKNPRRSFFLKMKGKEMWLSPDKYTPHNFKVDSSRIISKAS